MKKGYLGLEITPSRIRYTYGFKRGRIIDVQRAGTVSYTLNLSALGQLARAIGDILQKEEIFPRRIFVSISRKDILIRQLLMPRMTPKEIEEILPNEIEKVPSFANRKFDYIHQRYPAEKGNTRIIYAAIDQVLLDYIMKEVAALKIPFKHIDISPVNFKDLLAPHIEEHGNHVILVVNDKVSYFMVIRGGAYKVFYQTGIGLDNIYPENRDSMDQTAMTAFASELQRVIKSYQTEHRNEDFEKMWLIWDRPGKEDFEETIQRLLGIRVDVPGYRHIGGYEVSVEELRQNPVYLLSAMPMIFYVTQSKPSFSMDHFFRSFQIKAHVMKAVVMSLIFMAVVGYGLGVLGMDYYQQKVQLSKDIKQVEKEISTLKKESSDLYRKRDEYLEIRNGLLAQATYIQTLNRVLWSQVLSAVSKEMPRDVSLTMFKFSDSGTVTFRGDALEVETIADLIRKIDESKLLNNGRFDFLREKYIKKQKYFQFGIFAQLIREEASENEYQND
ncbi:MAG: PilN domain-containing protein [Candidatus Omnitrophica bacterium]|nr:PilN domain-containing protein [Candidatus Omnitrophota bacterium]